MQSPGLVPALVLFVSDVSAPFWEEREDLYSSPELLERYDWAHWNVLVQLTSMSLLGTSAL